MRQVVHEPGKDTRQLALLRKRARTNERFRHLVNSLQKMAVDGLVSPRWLLEAAQLVANDEIKRLYAIMQHTPTGVPGPKPQREDDS